MRVSNPIVAEASLIELRLERSEPAFAEDIKLERVPPVPESMRDAHVKLEREVMPLVGSKLREVLLRHYGAQLEISVVSLPLRSRREKATKAAESGENGEKRRRESAGTCRSSCPPPPRGK